MDIERVKETKFLGVIIDENLNWKPQIKHLQSKILKMIAILNKAKQALNNKSLHILYRSLVSPYLTYCAEVWANTFKSSLQSLFILPTKSSWDHKQSSLQGSHTFTVSSVKTVQIHPSNRISNSTNYV